MIILKSCNPLNFAVNSLPSLQTNEITSSSINISLEIKSAALIEQRKNIGRSKYWRTRQHLICQARFKNFVKSFLMSIKIEDFCNCLRSSYFLMIFELMIFSINEFAILKKYQYIFLLEVFYNLKDIQLIYIT